MTLDTLLHPFRHRDDEMAELRTQVRRRVRKVRSAKEMAVLVDDMIDALDAALVSAAPPDALPVTGPFRGQEWVASRWSCHASGPLTVEEAHQVTREHIACVPDWAICRIKYTALDVLTAAAIRVPDPSRGF
ncbi:hypothetical protein [Nocardia amamiensis]|uniref:hypothetical protein n=1 Tax=Nocardia amamiensis TaxID=404578 RepID=UPI0008358079|nr:hypothetical protein [Nocardia amamiensis]